MEYKGKEIEDHCYVGKNQVIESLDDNCQDFTLDDIWKPMKRGRRGLSERKNRLTRTLSVRNVGKKPENWLNRWRLNVPLQHSAGLGIM